MAKRDYSGNPIDATMQYITERETTGETVAGSSEDDHGDEETIAIPSFLDEGEYSTEQLEKIQNAILHPDETLKDICEQFGYHYPRTSTFLARFRREHEEELREAGLYEKLSYPRGGSQASEERDAKEPAKDRVREYYRNNPDASGAEVIENVDIGDLSKNQVCGLKAGVVRKGAGKPADDSGEEPDEATADAAADELLDHIEAMREDIQYLMEAVESDGSATPIGVSEDALFKIVAGQELSEQERREVFDAVVGGTDG